MTLFRPDEHNGPQRGGVKARWPFLLSLTAGLIILAVSIRGTLLLPQRPGVPPSIPRQSLVRVDDTDLRSAHDLNFVLAWKEIGDPADFTRRLPDGGLKKVRAPLVPFFGRSAFPWIYFCIGLLSIALGVLAYLRKPAEAKARLFYWLTVFFAAAIMINGEEYVLHPQVGWTYLTTFLFILSYALVPALLLHFSLTFAPPLFRFKRFLLYLPALLFIGLQEYLFLGGYLTRSIRLVRLYSHIYFVFRIYLAVYILAAIVHLARAYRKSQEEEPRSQVKWTFFGLAVGLTPFVFLYQLPRALGLSVALSEEGSNIFFVALPLALAIAIIRYRLMDINLVINRSLVYSLLTVFTVGIYLFVVQVAQGLLTRLMPIHQFYFSLAGVFLAAMAFQPAQRRIQDFVDRSFFRQRYDYRRIILDFNERARHTATVEGLSGYFLQEVRKALPVEKAGLEIRLSSQAGREGEAPFCLGDPLGAARLAAGAGAVGGEVRARRAAVQAPDLIDSFEEGARAAEALDLAVALPLSPKVGSGWLALGKKRSGQRFSREDIALLRTMAGELAAHLERILLQEEVVYERASKEKLDELNRLKTEFISSVSHELRTPMSAIQGLAEVLQAGKLQGREEKERTIDLMVAESGRLSRFLHNILDFGRIERQAKSYAFRPADLRGIVQEAVEILRGAFEARGFELRLRLPEGPVELNLDPDAVKQALINLLDNAMKYSDRTKSVEVEVRRGDTVEILVRDRGIGISPEDKAKIFDAFFRAGPAARLCPSGAGLGLKIVKHIMEAHGGRVRLESEEGRGSTFYLEFPRP